MKPLCDLHTHTVASGHAYSTLLENVHMAAMRGLKVYGHSDHARLMLGRQMKFILLILKSFQEKSRAFVFFMESRQIYWMN